MLYLENSPDPYPYQYTCFTIDLDYGFLTMFYVFAPGLLLSAFLIYGFWKKQVSYIYILITIVLTPLIFITYPLVLLVTKVSIL